VQPDVVALRFKLKAATLISGAASFLLALLCDMLTVQWVPRIYKTRFSLKSFECFMLMEFFDDAGMFMYGQMISSISGDTFDTDEIFMMALTFLSMLSILDEACKKKIFTIQAHPGTYPASSFHAFWNGPQGEETFLNWYRFRRDDFQRMVIDDGHENMCTLMKRPKKKCALWLRILKKGVHSGRGLSKNVFTMVEDPKKSVHSGR
jgi:hypothetical protein